MDKEIAILPYFLNTSHGRIFVIEYGPRPPNVATETVIFVPPFAEEMNRSRKMMTLQARALASNGLRAIMIDLHGTGDSGGDFFDARWTDWRDNILSVLSMLSSRVDGARKSVSFLAIRFGALLLFDGQTDLVSGANKIVLWNPCTSGSTFLRQFLRIRIASKMSENNSQKESIADLMDRFESGESVEVAGYEISAELAGSMGSATLVVDYLEKRPPMYWFEVVSDPESPLPVASNAAIEQLQRESIAVSVSSMCGEKFWSTVETTTVPDLVDATTSAFVDA